MLTSVKDKVLLKELAKALDRFAQGFDLEMVELKGTAPTVTWNKHGCAEFRGGTLAKYPRTLTLDQLQGMPELTTEKALEIIDASPVQKNRRDEEGCRCWLNRWKVCRSGQGGKAAGIRQASSLCMPDYELHRETESDCRGCGHCSDDP